MFIDKVISVSKKSSSNLYAVIDLGSNSFHMLVVREVNNSLQTVAKVKRKVRLAAGLDADNNLDQAALQRGWDCLSLFAEQLQDIPSANIRIVGTATLRLANNVAVFLATAEKILAYPVNIISGEQEAALIYKGVAYTSSGQGNRLVVDIGGASTELIIGEQAQAKLLYSFKMGCVTWLNNYFSDGKLNQHNFTQAINAAKAVLNPLQEKYLTLGWDTCIGASGTIQALQEIMVAQGENEQITLAKLHHIQQQAIACADIENLNIKGLATDRKPVFTSGLAILTALFESLDINNMFLAGGALREGVIYEMTGLRASHNVRQQTVNALMVKHQLDLEQAERVKLTALKAFDQLKTTIAEDDTQAGPLLAYVSSLHEIGLSIDYKKAPQHAAYLIDNTDMLGFTKAQKQLLSALLINQRDELNLPLLEQQSAVSYASALLLCRILRLACTLGLRRTDGTIPDFSLALTAEDTLTITLPTQWLAQHPLRAAALASELELLARQDLQLHIQER
ncbi:MAG: exopolyphosphatase/guanosine-5'-triphosphate,3'-diphosphate pyrophosphatase [Moritella dasanensis]